MSLFLSKEAEIFFPIRVPIRIRGGARSIKTGFHRGYYLKIPSVYKNQFSLPLKDLKHHLLPYYSRDTVRLQEVLS